MRVILLSYALHWLTNENKEEERQTDKDFFVEKNRRKNRLLNFVDEYLNEFKQTSSKPNRQMICLERFSKVILIN